MQPTLHGWKHVCGVGLDEWYRLVRARGRGGMGVVYEAVHVKLQKRVAVKLVRAEQATNEIVIARFGREARAAAAVGHRGIVDVYDVGIDSGCPFIVMEYLEGSSLGDLLKERGMLEISLAVQIVAQALAGLHAAHEAGVIHRDLKPDNVFLVDSGGNLPEVKLLDFGISKMVTPEEADEQLTNTGAMLGTPLYMSPEQAKGEKKIDHRADVYSAGVILYHCLTGEVPFKGENLITLVLAALTEPITSPRAYRPEIPEELEAVVFEALSLGREERFVSAYAMLEALLPFIDDEEIERLTAPPAPQTRSERMLWRTPLENLLEESANVEDAPEAGPETEILEPGEVKDSSWHEDVEGTTSDEKAPSRRGPLIALILFILVGGVIGLTLAFLSSDERDDLETSGVDRLEQTDAERLADEPSEEEEAGVSTGENVAEPEEEVTTITLEDVPEDAEVFLDGAVVDGRELRLKRSPVLREIRVDHQGRSWRRMVAPDEDRTLAVELVADEVPERGTKAPRTPRVGSKTTSDQPPGGQTPEKQGGPGSAFHPVFE